LNREATVKSFDTAVDFTKTSIENAMKWGESVNQALVQNNQNQLQALMKEGEMALGVLAGNIQRLIGAAQARVQVYANLGSAALTSISLAAHATDNTSKDMTDKTITTTRVGAEPDIQKGGLTDSFTVTTTETEKTS
jgi:hypothetical protein